jgi:hypothetical protein
MRIECGQSRKSMERNLDQRCPPRNDGMVIQNSGEAAVVWLN